MNGDNYSSRGAHFPRRCARIDTDRRDTDGGRHGSSRDYPVSWPASPLVARPKLTRLPLSLLGETATTGATEAIPETEAAAADARAPPTTAAADPVAKTATSMPTRPAAATVIASARTATRDGTVGEVTAQATAQATGQATGASENGTVIGAAGVGGTMTTGATGARSGT